MSHFFARSPSAYACPGLRLAAPVGAGQGVDTSKTQSILNSSSCVRFECSSRTSTHLNPVGAAGCCGACELGSLNRAPEMPSLTPDFIAEYSTQYVSSKPIPAAINGSSNPSPINAMAAPLFVKEVDLKESGPVNTGNEMRKGRPPIHASEAAKKAAYRAGKARIDYTDTPEIVEKLKETAVLLDCSVNELLQSMVRFAQCNRNWKQLGLFGARTNGVLR